MQARWRCGISASVFDYCLSLCVLLSYEGSVSSQASLTVRITPSSDYFEEDKPASLICVIAPSATAQNEDYPLLWSRDGGLPASSSINNTQTGSEAAISYRSTLTFTAGPLDNQIAIVCSARVGASSGSASYTPRIILVPDDPVIIAPNRSDASGNLTWTCHSKGASQSAPNVYWRDGSGAALIFGVGRTTTVKQQPNQNVVYLIVLTITREAKVFVAAKGLICVVVHELAQYSSRRSATQVLDLPRVYKNGSDLVYVTENVRQTLSCIVNIGFPPALNVTWTKDGQSMTLPSPGRYEKVNITSANLVILSVSKHDMGDYLCTATSLLGNATFTSPTTVIVRYRPQILLSTNETTAEATAGGSVLLQCPVDCFPHPTSIHWNRVLNEQTYVLNISSDLRYSGGSVLNQQYGLTISTLQASDAGVYICDAVNEVGRGTGPYMTLIVTSPSVPVLYASTTDNTAAVVFGVISLILLVIIIMIIVATCYLCKCSKGHERARVSPFMDDTAKHSGRLFLPPLNPESGNTAHSDEDSTTLTTPITFLPPARQDDHEPESVNSGSLPDTSETPVFRLPPLDPETRSYDIPFRWSAHLQNNSQTPYDNVFKVSSGPVISSLDQTSVLRDRLAMMK